MRAAWLLPLAACGRLGFDHERIASDASIGDSASIGDAAQAPSLVAWWRMEAYETEGEVMGIVDSTGVTGSLAACSGTTCPAIVPGKVGNAAMFDGVDDMLEAASMPALVDSTFTVGAWIMIDAATTGTTVQCPYGKGLGTGIFDSWSVCIFSNLAAYFYSAQSTMSNELDTGTAMTEDAWHYVAIRFDGTTKSLFEDGQLIGSSSATGVDYDDDPVYIGADVDNGSPTGYFTGLVDELRVYNRALGDDEIVALSQ